MRQTLAWLVTFRGTVTRGEYLAWGLGVNSRTGRRCSRARRGTRTDFGPRAYWAVWSDYLLHTIHRRVLLHIRDGAERAAGR